MSLSESALFLERASVPTMDAVVANIAGHGHILSVPAGFSLTLTQQLVWVPVVVDGEKAGFDYGIFAREGYEGNDPESPALPDFGDTVLAFVARHDQISILAVSLVQRAICELTDAQGWWQEGEERFNNSEMIDFCTATIESIKANPAPVAAVGPRFGSDYFRTVGRSFMLGVALMAAAALLIFLMGYFFAPGAPQ